MEREGKDVVVPRAGDGVGGGGGGHGDAVQVGQVLGLGAMFVR